MPNTNFELNRIENPVDVIERIAALSSWAFEREDDDEIAIAVSGRWCDYQVSFTWLEEMEALHMACAFDLKVPEWRRAEILNLIASVNAQLWVGHFDLWRDENAIMFRHGLLLTGGITPTREQCAALMNIAVEACERYFQSFQFVIWAGKTASEALDGMMLETVGEA